MRKVLIPILFIGGLGIAAHRLYSGVRTQDAGERLTVDVTAVDFLGVKSVEALFRIHIRVSNPSDKTLHTDYINLECQLEEGGTVFIIREPSLGKQYPIGGNSSVTFPVVARVSLVSLALTSGKVFYDAVIGKKGLPSQVRIKGEIKVNSFPVQINKLVSLRSA